MKKIIDKKWLEEENKKLKEKFRKMAEDQAKFEVKKREAEEGARGLIIKEDLWPKNIKSKMESYTKEKLKG